jgi:Mrp family chromosome partitioning ATPase
LIGAGAKPLRSRKAGKSEADEPEPITIRAAPAPPEREAAPPIYQSRRRPQDSARRAQDRVEADIMTDEGPIRPPTRRATDRLNPDKTEDAPMRDIGRIARSLTSTTTPAPQQDNFIERLRRIQLSTPNTPPTEMKPVPVQPPAATPTRPDDATGDQPKEATAAQPNDLRRYLQQRAASSKPDLSDLPPRPADGDARTQGGRVAPVVRSLDALINQIFAEHVSNKQRLVLIAAASPKANAAPTTIEIARLLAANAERAVLVDLTRGSTAISGPLGLPRAPGFNDLLAGSAGFEDVVRIDAKSVLQVIVAGNAKPKSDGNEAQRSVRIFSALAQAYDLVVLYGDQESVAKFQAALQGRLAMAIAVLAGGGDLTTAMASIAELTAFGAPVFPYDKSTEEDRPGIFGRAAAS